MDLRDELLDASLPAEPFPLLGLHPADAIPRALLASDASAAVLPVEAADETVPAPAAVPYAEKLAAPAQAVQALTAVALPAEARVPCIPDADRFAA
jgi:hypothetical protein